LSGVWLLKLLRLYRYPFFLNIYNNYKHIRQKRQKRLQFNLLQDFYPPKSPKKIQEIYSLQSTRQIFDRLAHSSIMRRTQGHGMVIFHEKKRKTVEEMGETGEMWG
jgi:hypothetical protein